MPAQRPLSPHLLIYKPQLTSMLSISHRLTGLALAAGSVLLVCWLVALASGPEAFAGAQAVAGHWAGKLVLFGFSLALFYHLSNGIRHLCWDMGYGLGLEAVYRGGWIVLGSTVLLTLASWLLATMIW